MEAHWLIQVSAFWVASWYDVEELARYLRHAHAEIEGLHGLHERGERAKWALIWSLLEEFGITRANGCPDSILRQEWDALKQRAEAAEARAEAAEAECRALSEAWDATVRDYNRERERAEAAEASKEKAWKRYWEIVPRDGTTPPTAETHHPACEDGACHPQCSFAAERTERTRE